MNRKATFKKKKKNPSVSAISRGETDYTQLSTVEIFLKIASILRETAMESRLQFERQSSVMLVTDILLKVSIMASHAFYICLLFAD